MSASHTWKSLFVNWPAELPRRGVVLSIINEQTPFKNFWIQDEMLLLERKNPDTSGGRYVLLGFDALHSVKFIDPLSDATIAEAGFSADGAGRVKQLV